MATGVIVVVDDHDAMLVEVGVVHARVTGRARGGARAARGTGGRTTGGDEQQAGSVAVSMGSSSLRRLHQRGRQR